MPQQGAHGSAAEGRQAYVGVLFNPTPEFAEPPKQPAGLERPKSRANTDPAVPARYVAGLYGLDELEPIMRRQGAQLGMDSADVWVAISDGGSGLEDVLERAFPRAEAVILDYWHASEYLADLAKALYPGDTDRAEAARMQWCGLLLDEGGTVPVEYLRQERWPPHAETAWTAAETYFANQQHRMEYPEYTARGWCIGSGVVESGCKTVVAQRLKLAGMRWGEDGADAVCHVRAVYRGDKAQWDALWTPSDN